MHKRTGNWVSHLYCGRAYEWRSLGLRLLQGCGRGLSLSEILNVNVSAQSHVVGKVPADVVRIVIDDDLIAIPEPVIGKANIKGSDAEEEAAKPETARSAALNPENVPRAKAAPKMSVLPGTIKVVMRIVTAGIMADPFVVGVNMGRVRMSRLVVERAIVRCGTLPGANRRGTVSGNVRAGLVAIAVASVSFLGHADE